MWKSLIKNQNPTEKTLYEREFSVFVKQLREPLRTSDPVFQTRKKGGKPADCLPILAIERLSMGDFALLLEVPFKLFHTDLKDERDIRE